MDSAMVETQDDVLTSALFRVASDPALVTTLHEIIGDFCHECRNALNSFKLSMYLAKRDLGLRTSGLLDDVESRYEAVEHRFERLQSICRPMALRPIRASLALVVEERSRSWTEAMAARGRELTFIPPQGPDVGDFDPVRLPESLDAFIQWRAEVGEAGSPALLRWGARDGRFELEWDEPGAECLVGSVRDPERPDPLALPFLARVITAHGGTTTLDLRDGLRLGACWPLVVHPT
jgi:hypothetical protein